MDSSEKAPKNYCPIEVQQRSAVPSAKILVTDMQGPLLSDPAVSDGERRQSGHLTSQNQRIRVIALLTAGGWDTLLGLGRSLASRSGPRRRCR